MLDPRGRTILISGANRGFGHVLACRLHAEGYNVSAGGRDPDELEQALAAQRGDRLACHRFDATVPAHARRWVTATLDRFGAIEGLINNAGMLDQSPLEALGDEALDAMWEVNVKGPLRLIREALPALRSGGAGRIVNVSSLSGLRVKGTFAPGYAMTKFAVTALTEAVKSAAYDDGVRVTALCPGFIATDMTADFGEEPSTMIQPDDLAELVTTVLALPNTAAVAQLAVSCRLEPGL